jgi:hypothetical protein
MTHPAHVYAASGANFVKDSFAKFTCVFSASRRVQPFQYPGGLPGFSHSSSFLVKSNLLCRW